MAEWLDPLTREDASVELPEATAKSVLGQPCGCVSAVSTSVALSVGRELVQGHGPSVPASWQAFRQRRRNLGLDSGPRMMYKLHQPHHLLVTPRDSKPPSSSPFLWHQRLAAQEIHLLHGTSYTPRLPRSRSPRLACDFTARPVQVVGVILKGTKACDGGRTSRARVSERS